MYRRWAWYDGSCTRSKGIVGESETENENRKEVDRRLRREAWERAVSMIMLWL